jgi:hypothetical protein
MAYLNSAIGMDSYPSKDYDRSKTTRECGMFQLFG